ncbi:MAG: Fur family transcriptional regulator [Myxococcota bacterium]
MAHSAGTEGLLDRLRKRGWRMTAQRRAVAESLTGSNLHLTAEEVFDRAGHILPELSRATVYNTLNELVDMGELQVASFDGGLTRRYDPNAVQPHHHLSCRSCGKVVDIPQRPSLPDLSKRHRQGFEVETVHVVYEGLCAGCRSPNAHGAGPTPRKRPSAKA